MAEPGSYAAGAGRAYAASGRRALAARGAVLLLGFGGTLACAREAEPGPWQGENGIRWRALATPGPGGPGFTSLPASETGIAFANGFTERSLLENDVLANGSGVALGDYDADGRADVYLLSVEGRNALYRNLGGWRFEDVTEEAGVGLAGSVSRGAAWVDVDGDGHLDLIVTRHSEPNVLFRSVGDGTFEEAPVGFEAALASHSLALADTDGDGDLDLYVTNYKDRWARDAFPPAERAYERVIGEEEGRFFIRSGFEDYFRVIETPEGPRRWEFGEPDEFYRNEGGRFVRVPFAGGPFTDENGRPLARDPDEWGLAVRFADLDLDGDPDLYVCNDINSPDHIWINDGQGRFRWIDPLAIRKTSAASMAVDVADVDRDGWPDLFVAEMLSPDPARRKRQVPEMESDPARPGEVETRPQVKRNTLQMSRGDGTYAETALMAGVAASGWTWGALFLDVDLDGFEDLLLTNGNVLDWLDGDAQERTQGVGGGPDWRRLRLQFPPLPLANRAYRNEGDGTFHDAGEAWGFALEPDVSHGVAAADLDGDGDLDLVVNRLDAPALVLRNDATDARLAIRLRGSGPNTRAIGARVRVAFEGLPVQERELAAGGLYLSDSSDQLTFAAGEGGGAVTVFWPGGGETRLDEIRAGRLYELHQPGPGDAAREGRGRAGESPPSMPGPSGGTWFEDVSDVLAHVHPETIFDEFARQPLVPIRFAQLGPGVSWIDEDRDGYPDLWIGTARGGRLLRARNRAGRLVPSEVGPPAPGDVTTLLPSGRMSTAPVLAGLMNYEAADPRAGMSQPAVVGAGTPEWSPVVPGAPSTTGPLARADWDGDGDLDLFVGGRVIPTAYPVPASSRFLASEPGGWREEPANAAALEDGALVSAAVFSDVDSDGDPDLLLATEWGPVRLLENEGGRFRDRTDAWGLGGAIGRWNGIATGDLNEDGRPDIVATAWGTNTEAALDGAGTEVLHGDLDRNGIYDAVELEVRPDGRRYPTLRLDQLGRGLAFLRRAAPDHETYASMGLDELLPDAPDLQSVSARELRHTVFLSGDRGYTARALPDEAQRAPAFGVSVADLNGDGHQDVALATNFFANKLDTPRYDAGRGLLLTGDGTGRLDPVPAARSGVLAYGDGRGLAVGDYDADGRLDLALGQNGSRTKLFHNRGAAPGLRVRLLGPAVNPDAVGAVVRVEYESGFGPAHEVQSGSGYWSHDQLLPTLGLADTPVAVRVTWPGGASNRVAVPAGAREITVESPGGTR